MAATPDTLIAGLDIGSSKVTAIAVDYDSDGNVHYVGGAFRPSAGVRNGIIVDIGEASACVEAVIYELEERCGRRITSACIAVSGPHVQGHLARGTITPMGGEIKHEDVTQAIALARQSLTVHQNGEIIHEIPRAYRVDGQPGVHDPHGMAGYELEVEVHYATGISTTISNLLKCVTGARIEPAMLVAAPLAAGEAVRVVDERAECVVVADVGAETTDVAIYADGSLWWSAVLTGGGAEITREIVSQLKLPWAAAEELKQRYGQCGMRRVEEYELVDLPPSAGFDGFLPRAELTRVITRRAEQQARALAEQLAGLREQGLIPEALILTGGGSELAGLDDVLMRALEMPVYRATPRGIEGLPPALGRPAFATVAGLTLWCARYAPLAEGTASNRRIWQRLGLRAGMRKLLRVVMP